MTNDDETQARAPVDPAPSPRKAPEEIEAAARGTDGRQDGAKSESAMLRERIADLVAEVARLERINAAMARENDELNVALIELSIERSRQSAEEQVIAASAEAPAAEEPEHEHEPVVYFAPGGDAEVFECAIGEATARVFIPRRKAGQPLRPKVHLPAVAIGADGTDMAGATCEIRLDPQGSAGEAIEGWAWSGERREAVCASLLVVASAIEEALSDENGAPPANVEAWASLSAYLAAFGERVRSPSMDGSLLGPVALSGVGPWEVTGAGEARWTTTSVAAFAIFATRMGRLTLALQLRSLASDQSITVRLDGEQLLDADLPADAGAEVSAFEIGQAIDWGVHLLEIEAPAFEREQGGAFRNLHLLLEKLELTWTELSEFEEPEAELFGWAPPLFKAPDGD